MQTPTDQGLVSKMMVGEATAALLMKLEWVDNQREGFALHVWTQVGLHAEFSPKLATRALMVDAHVKSEYLRFCHFLEASQKHISVWSPSAPQALLPSTEETGDTSSHKSGQPSHRAKERRSVTSRIKNRLWNHLNILTPQPPGDYWAFVILTGIRGENYYTTQKEIAACQQQSHAQARRLMGGWGGALWRWDQNRTFV